MWGESSNDCEGNCQCSGLITESFRINSGGNSKKRKQEEATSTNYKLKMNPHSLDFRRSPLSSPMGTPKRRVLGEIHNSIFRPDLDRIKSPNQISPLARQMKSVSQSPESIHTLKELKSPLQSPLARSILSPDQLNRIEQSPLARIISPDQFHSKMEQSPLSRVNGMDHSTQLHSRIDQLKSPLQMSPFHKSPLARISNDVLINQNSSPLTSRLARRSKITRVFEERSRFKCKMSDKENCFMSESFVKLDVEEETRDCSFGGSFGATPTCSMAKLDFTDALPRPFKEEPCKETFVPQEDLGDTLDPDLDTLHDLEEEFDADSFEQCTKYEIISTDSPNIISRGRSTSRKITSANFDFGAPLSEQEQSTSFNKANSTNRMLNFEDESFEFTSPATKRPSTSTTSVKKSLKFTETPTKLVLQHERSDSSIGSMVSSPSSSKLRFPSESTSMESGFVSELEEPFLDIEEVSNSPKMANFNELLSGQIKDNFIPDKFTRPKFHRSISYSLGASKARASLFSITESPSLDGERKTFKRSVELGSERSKRRKSNCSPEQRRPVLMRANSENNASIMSAMARYALEPNLIADFSQPYSLPLTSGDHHDLKSISSETLAALLRGQYSDAVPEYQVIDCRYPYEFTGGHVTGAVNLYTPAHIARLMASPRPARRVLVFHCEFSRERGPKLSRYLRSSDRASNKDSYPSLHYPEVYLLHGGYSEFYRRHPELCSPPGYTSMLDPGHRHLLRKHRSEGGADQIRRNRLL